MDTQPVDRENFITKLIRECIAKHPNCTLDQIKEFLLEKGVDTITGRSWGGHLGKLTRTHEVLAEGPKKYRTYRINPKTTLPYVHVQRRPVVRLNNPSKRRTRPIKIG